MKVAVAGMRHDNSKLCVVFSVNLFFLSSSVFKTDSVPRMRSSRTDMSQRMRPSKTGGLPRTRSSKTEDLSRVVSSKTNGLPRNR